MLSCTCITHIAISLPPLLSAIQPPHLLYITHTAMSLLGPVCNLAYHQFPTPHLLYITPNQHTQITPPALTLCRPSARLQPYCELSSIVYMTGEECQICDGLSSDASRRHPITNIIDGTDAWWQGPTLEQGADNQWITIEVDLRQVRRWA